MHIGSQTTDPQYRVRPTRVLANAVLVILADFLAFALLQEALFLACFVAASCTVTLTMFLLKLHPLIQTSSQLSTTTQQASNSVSISQHKKLTIFLLIAAILFPFALFLTARILEPTIWFLLLASVASGIGTSEVLFYAYCKIRVRRI